MIKPDPMKSRMPQDWYKQQAKNNAEIKRLERIDFIVRIIFLVAIFGHCPVCAFANPAFPQIIYRWG